VPTASLGAGCFAVRPTSNAVGDSDNSGLDKTEGDRVRLAGVGGVVAHLGAEFWFAFRWPRIMRVEMERVAALAGPRAGSPSDG
jgi:hypothetical protein